MATTEELKSRLLANESLAANLIAKKNETDAKATEDYWTALSANQAAASNPTSYDLKIAALSAQQAFDASSSNADAAAKSLETAKAENASLNSQLIANTDPTITIKSPEQTNPDQSAAETARLMRQGNSPGDGTAGTTDESYNNLENKRLSKSLSPPTAGDFARQDRAAYIASSAAATPATPQWGTNDHRARLRVPSSYLVGPAAGPNKELLNNSGIIFPYTPTIGQEYKANYTPVAVTHSNYTPQFYKSSSVGEISLSAKFTVQNETDACIFLATVHLLRALTKMKFGDDDNAGSPPPVCRLMALGDFGFNNAPVAVGSFKFECPDNVDYIETGNKISTYGRSFVPVLSTISLTLIPIYSRNEMQKFTVKGWLDANTSRLKGYL